MECSRPSRRCVAVVVVVGWGVFVCLWRLAPGRACEHFSCAWFDRMLVAPHCVTFCVDLWTHVVAFGCAIAVIS